jgi:hypothetical protein
MVRKKLSAAYDICHRSGNNILRALVFAFTTSTHLTGSEDRILKQLETGREIAAQMGGKDRQDGVGLVALGLWFTVKLKREWGLTSRVLIVRLVPDEQTRRRVGRGEAERRGARPTSTRFDATRRATVSGVVEADWLRGVGEDTLHSHIPALYRFCDQSPCI